MIVLFLCFILVSVSGVDSSVTVDDSNSINNGQSNNDSDHISSTSSTTSGTSQPQSCRSLDISLLSCKYPTHDECVYGSKSNVSCSVKNATSCTGEREFSVSFTCSYCYQLPKDKYSCAPRLNCRSTGSPPERIIVNCTVHPQHHCLGRRVFRKSFTCSWTSGTRWSTAFLLSITLGGFGADRFYLGHWEEGLGKFFSFGGLGVWTLVDIVLVGIGYITPKDGSLYIF